ncbi:BID domain-containing T4SS effector [Bartonella doshiae]|uniref:protein adenylyltransferase n=2 Tax=Bartonella doshiae TaxID=33044 RepID=A0A380ZFW8_BARDO|nr:BID domain-containing T4SS effector [Bartonella doshiae]EJF79035.1 hypothetical protein MCS_01529 [Bartonella doshiae NCTC 12862 = ATCC 700133]MBB6159882.1 cell filamentation protein [Bartonella doshiae]SUV45440.1 Probable adenosine monophosphate-protein transferase fic [Bartonella doshiae]
MLEHNYLYKNGTTLKNKYGIKNSQKLYARTANDAAKEAVNFRYEPPPRKFNSQYLKTIHWSLFHKSFEWAGQTRDKLFTFEDGSSAHMPAMRPKGYPVPFAIGPQIQKRLKQLDRKLAAMNNLQGLSRQDFVENAATVFAELNSIHPFRKGNGRAQRMFMEKLGQAAGYEIDFSFTTKERMDTACIAAMQHGNQEPMHHLFEDITHPQKAFILKEFIYQMKECGLSQINNRVVVAAKEGVKYDGFYRGHAAEGFVIEAKDVFVIGHIDDLSPQQIKTLRDGDYISFEKTNIQNLQKTLIPAEILMPLTYEELVEKITSDPFVEICQKEVLRLSKIVYGKTQTLDEKLEMIYEDPNLCEQLADKIAEDPKSINKLAGRKILCIKSPKRRRAEKAVSQLSETLKGYATTIQRTKDEILENHEREQRCKKQLVEYPSKNLQQLFSLPQEQRGEVLSHSRALQQELHVFSRKLYNRLSSEERKAIEEQNHTRLSCLLGTSESKAKEISNILKQTKETQHQVRTLKISRCSSMALTN